MMDLLVSGFWGVVAAVIYSVIFYGKALQSSGETFDFMKMLYTIILGACIGAGMAILNLPVTMESLEVQITTYGFMIVIIENLLKILMRALTPPPPPSP